MYHFHDMMTCLLDVGLEKEQQCSDMDTIFAKAIGSHLPGIGQLMDGLKDKPEAAYKASGGRKVNIISHIMGGLLVSCFMYLHGDLNYDGKTVTLPYNFAILKGLLVLGCGSESSPIDELSETCIQSGILLRRW